MTKKANEKKQVIKQIINQANSLNKKIKAFRDENILDHLTFVKAMFNNEQMQYTDDDRITKSTKFYGEQNILELKRTITALRKINHHEIFGTVKKYNKNYSDAWDTLIDTVKNSLLKKGYSESHIVQIINTKQFINDLCIALKDVKKDHGSDQVIEKVFLQHSKGIISEEEIDRSISDILHAQERVNQVTNEEEEFQNWKRNKNMR